MENRFLRLIGIVLCVPMLGFMGAAFLLILTVTAVAPVIIALLSAFMALVGIDWLLQGKKVLSAPILFTALCTLILAIVLFS